MSKETNYICCFCGKTGNYYENKGFSIGLQPLENWREKLGENIQGYMCHTECLAEKFRSILCVEAANTLNFENDD